MDHRSVGHISLSQLGIVENVGIQTIKSLHRQHRRVQIDSRLYAVSSHTSPRMCPAPLAMSIEVRPGTSSTSCNRSCFGELFNSDCLEEYSRVKIGGLSSLLSIELLLGLACNVCFLAMHTRRKTGVVTNLLVVNLNVLNLVICTCAIPGTLATLYASDDCHVDFALDTVIAFLTPAIAANVCFMVVQQHHAIVVPLRQNFTIASRVSRAVAAVWLIGVGGLCSQLVVRLTADVDSPRYDRLYSAVSHCVTCAVIIGCCVRIVRTTNSRVGVRLGLVQVAFIRLQRSASSSTICSRRKIACKVVAMLVGTMTVCWGPYMVVCFLTAYRRPPCMALSRVRWLCIAYLSAIIYPLTCAFMRRTFREAFARWLCRLQQQTRLWYA